MPITKENKKLKVGCVELSSPIDLHRLKVEFEHPQKIPVDLEELRAFLNEQKRVLNSILNNVQQTHNAVGKEVCKQEDLTHAFRFVIKLKKVQGFHVVVWHKFVSYGKGHKPDITEATKAQILRAKYISDWELELCKFLFEELSPIENYITQLIELSARLSTLDSTVKRTK